MRDRLVEEICEKGELKPYRSEVKMAIELAWDCGFKVCTRYDSPNSETVWDEKLIRVAVGRVVEAGLPCLWDLLHEIGHIKDGNPGHRLSLKERIPREDRAWGNAWILVKEYFPMVPFQNQFVEKYF